MEENQWDFVTKGQPLEEDIYGGGQKDLEWEFILVRPILVVYKLHSVTLPMKMHSWTDPILIS